MMNNVEFVTCSHCNGSGVVEKYINNDSCIPVYYQCQTCKGFGTIMVKDDNNEA